MTPSWRSGRAVPLGLAAVAAVVAVVVGEPALVDRDAASRAGQLRGVIFVALAASAVAYFVARRVLGGPGLVRHEWILEVAPFAPRVATVGDLVDRLAARGYRLELRGVAADGELGGAAAPARGDALPGAAFALLDPRLGAPPALVVLRLGGDPAGSNGLGLVSACDRRGARGYEELARYVMAELDVLAPGLGFKLGASTLAADEARVLREVLPETPRALGGRR